MKIMRFLSEAGQIFYGVPDPDDWKQARIIDGNIYKKFEVRDAYVKVDKILAPVLPPNILALGLNYRSHADETRFSYPETPVLFIKSTNSLLGPGAQILLPRAGCDHIDYEGELVIVIGKRIKNVTAEEAWDAILGYTCGNDVSARDWQFEKQKGQWSRGKSFDTFCPLGPWLVTTDEIPDPGNLKIRTLVNGKVLQDSSTADMIFDIPTIVSNLSQSMTLYPGTVILTGTPEGVGFTQQPPVFLKKGDTVTVSIDGIGELTNPVEMES
jgi:2-keto-4-pentenoate hydratase/2-oxohepta-3-ene-1,7-dioic acid hydratase in catechol pathway